MTQTKSIKASLGFRKLSAGDVVARANAVLDGLYTGKDDYPDPPVDQATLKPKSTRCPVVSRPRWMAARKLLLHGST